MMPPLVLLLLLLLCIQHSCSWSVLTQYHSTRASLATLWSSTAKSSSETKSTSQEDTGVAAAEELRRLQGKILKQMRLLAQEYEMIQEGDHIMVCVSGGKDSATLLYLLRELQNKLPISFQITAVHVNQKQPGYNGTFLVKWLNELQVNYTVVEEDTYSVVVEKTPPQKSYCTVCSRLRRGILYSTAISLNCNKIMLGHHGDDALETLLLNMMHSGVLKGMPPRYTTRARNVPLAVLRPLLTCLEKDVAKFALLQKFPILPCNLCSNQANLQRPQVKALLNALERLAPRAKLNMIHSMTNVQPSHLMDSTLREMCGFDPVTGEAPTLNVERSDGGNVRDFVCENERRRRE